MQLLDILEYSIRGIILIYLCDGAIAVKNKYLGQGKYIFFLLFVVWSFWLGNSKRLNKFLYGAKADVSNSSDSIIKVALMFVACFLLMEVFYEGTRLLKLYLSLLFETLIELSHFGIHCFWSLGINAYISCMTGRLLEGKIDIDTYGLMVKHIEIIALTILTVAYSALSWLTVYVIRKHGKNIRDADRQGLMFLMISPAVGMAFGLILRVMLFTREGAQIEFLYDRHRGMYVIVPVMVLLCILSIVYSIKIYEELMNVQEEKSSLIYYRQQAADMSEHIQEMERLYDGIRALRHDMNNYMADMEQLLDMGVQHGDKKGAEAAQAEAKKYLYHMKDSLDSMTMRYSTGNPVTDVILNRKYRECEKRGINFDSDFIYPDKLAIEAFDLGILMNNALDNAIEAYGRCSGETRYGIKVHSYTKEPMFFIRIENDCNGKALNYSYDGELRTSKEDDWMHGIGLKNMKRVVDKYYGTMSYEVKDNVFYMTVMLQGKAAERNVCDGKM